MKRWKFEEIKNGDVRRRIEVASGLADRTSVPAPDMEQDTGNAPMAEKEAPGLDTQRSCRIHVHSNRNRLTDADGVSAKAVIDALVLCNVLKDDSTQYVEAVSYSQSKVKGQETTILEISQVIA